MAIPLILCGGAGTRLWPLSRPECPKPFLRLWGNRSLLQHTLQRFCAFERPVLVCHASHASLVQEQCREMNIAPRAVLLEPAPRGTAAATMAAITYLKSTFDDTTLIISPADLAIRNQPIFEEDICAALRTEYQSKWITFGIVPREVNRRFGYIEIEREVSSGVFTVRQFLGKPAEELRDAQLAQEKYFWNSGMFVVSLENVHRAMSAFHPLLETACQRAVQNAHGDETAGYPLIKLNSDAFAEAPKLSFESAVQDELSQGVMVRARFDWNDAGTWNALWELQAQSPADNVGRGAVRWQQSRGCYAHATTKRISVLGCQDLVVVETDDEILVTTRQQAEAVGFFAPKMQKDERK